MSSSYGEKEALSQEALKQENEQLKQALAASEFNQLETQARLHQAQEALATAKPNDVETNQHEATEQLRLQLNEIQSQLWILKACVACSRRNWPHMKKCLEASLDCNRLPPEQTLAYWTQCLKSFCQEAQIFQVTEQVTAEEWINTAEWQSLVRQVAVTSLE